MADPFAPPQSDTDVGSLLSTPTPSQPVAPLNTPVGQAPPLAMLPKPVQAVRSPAPKPVQTNVAAPTPQPQSTDPGPVIGLMNVDGQQYQLHWKNPTPPSLLDLQNAVQSLRSSQQHYANAFLSPKDPDTEKGLQDYANKYLSESGKGSIPSKVLDKISLMPPGQRYDAIPPAMSTLGKTALMRAAWNRSGAGTGSISAQPGAVSVNAIPPPPNALQRLGNRAATAIQNVTEPVTEPISEVTNYLKSAGLAAVEPLLTPKPGEDTLSTGMPAGDITTMQNIASLPFAQRMKALEGQGVRTVGQPAAAAAQAERYKTLPFAKKLGENVAGFVLNSAVDPTMWALGTGILAKAPAVSQLVAGGIGTQVVAPYVAEPSKIWKDPAKAIIDLPFGVLAALHAGGLGAHAAPETTPEAAPAAEHPILQQPTPTLDELNRQNAPGIKVTNYGTPQQHGAGEATPSPGVNPPLDIASLKTGDKVPMPNGLQITIKGVTKTGVKASVAEVAPAVESHANGQNVPPEAQTVEPMKTPTVNAQGYAPPGRTTTPIARPNAAPTVPPTPAEVSPTPPTEGGQDNSLQITQAGEMGQYPGRQEANGGGNGGGVQQGHQGQETPTQGQAEAQGQVAPFQPTHIMQTGTEAIPVRVEADNGQQARLQATTANGHNLTVNRGDLMPVGSPEAEHAQTVSNIHEVLTALVKGNETGLGNPTDAEKQEGALTVTEEYLNGGINGPGEPGTAQPGRTEPGSITGAEQPTNVPQPANGQEQAARSQEVGGPLTSGVPEPVRPDNAVAGPEGQQGPILPAAAEKPASAAVAGGGIAEGTGAKNAITEAERADRGLVPEVIKQIYKGPTDAYLAGKDLVDSGKLDPRGLAQTVADKPRALTPEETGALAYDRMRIINEDKQGRTDRADMAAKIDAQGGTLSPEDTVRAAELKLQQQRTEDAYQRNDEALQRGGRENSAALNSRKMLVKADYTPLEVKQRIRVNQNMEPLSDKQNDQVDRLTHQNELLTNLLEEKTQALAAAQSARDFELARRQTKSQQRTQTGTDLKADFEVLKTRFREALGNPEGGVKLHTALDPTGHTLDEASVAKIVPVLRDMARNLVAQGVNSAGAVVDSVHDAVKDYVADISKRDVRDMISGYGKQTVNRATTDVQARLNELQRQMTLVSKIADAQQGIAPDRRGPNGAPSPEVAALRQQLADAMKASGIEVPRTPPSVATRQAAMVKNISDRIADLDRRINERDFSKTSNGNVTPDTPEITALKAQRATLQKTFDRMSNQAQTAARQAALTPADRLKSEIAKSLNNRGADGFVKSVGDVLYKKLVDGTALTDAERAKINQAFVDNKPNSKPSTSTPSAAMASIRSIVDQAKADAAAISKANRPPLTPDQLFNRRLTRTLGTDGAAAFKNSADPAALKSLVSGGTLTPEQLNSLAKNFIDNQKPSAKPAELTGAAKTLQDAVTATRKATADAARAANPTVRDPLPGIKAGLRRQIADLERRVAEKQLEPNPPKPKTALDAEAQQLRDRRDEVRMQLDRMIAAANKPTLTDKILKFQRGAMMLGVGSAGKVGAAANLRIVTDMIDELPSGIVSRLNPRIAANAPREGGSINVKAAVDSMRAAMSPDTVRDAVQKLTTRSNSMDVEHYGLTGKMNPHELDAGSLIEMGQALHGALKTPTQRAAYDYGMAKRTAWAYNHGLDTNDPQVITEIHLGAYDDGTRAILMNENQISDFLKAGPAMLERKYGANDAANAVRSLTPITRVPSNFAGDTAQYVAGGLYGFGKAIRARGGIKNFYRIAVGKDADTLTQDQCDSILRAYKKQGIGTATVAAGVYIGYNTYNAVRSGTQKPGISASGYHYPHEKLQPGEEKSGDINVYGHVVPHVLTHNTLVSGLQLGVTFGRSLAEQHEKAQTGNPDVHPIGTSLYNTGVGYAEQLPFAEVIKNVGGVMTNETTAGNAAGEQLGTVIPQIAQEAARYTDRDANGRVIPRDARGFTETMKTKIPGLRRQVPLKVNNDVKSGAITPGPNDAPRPTAVRGSSSSDLDKLLSVPK